MKFEIVLEFRFLAFLEVIKKGQNSRRRLRLVCALPGGGGGGTVIYKLYGYLPL